MLTKGIRHLFVWLGERTRKEPVNKKRKKKKKRERERKKIKKSSGEKLNISTMKLC